MLTEGTPPGIILAEKKWHYKHPYYSPDGKNLAYFSDEGSPGVFHLWRLNLRSGKKKQLTFGDTQNHSHPVFSPDGTRIVFHAYEGTDENAVPVVTNLCELELASGAVRQLTSGADQYKHPFYLSDRLITCHHERNRDGVRRLEVLDLHTLRRFRLTSARTTTSTRTGIDRKRRVRSTGPRRSAGRSPAKRRPTTSSAGGQAAPGKASLPWRSGAAGR
jgi:Tol biopolymer transport system component